MYMFYLIKRSCNLWLKKWIKTLILLLSALPCIYVIKLSHTQLFCSPCNDFLWTSYKYNWSFSLQNLLSGIFIFANCKLWNYSVYIFLIGFSSFLLSTGRWNPTLLVWRVTRGFLIWDIAFLGDIKKILEVVWNEPDLALSPGSTPPKLNEDVSKEHLRTDASRNCFYNKGNIKAKEERLVFQ